MCWGRRGWWREGCGGGRVLMVLVEIKEVGREGMVVVVLGNGDRVRGRW